jgi:hypothetical protein
MLAKAAAIFGEYKLPPEGAQKLVDFHVETMQAATQAATQAIETRQRQVWLDIGKQWVEAFENDPQIGGNRKNTSLRIARGVLTTFAGSEDNHAVLAKDLTDTGMANNPHLARTLVNVGSFVERVLHATGTTDPEAALKKLREPKAPPPGTPARAPGTAGRPADKRYASK